MARRRTENNMVSYFGYGDVHKVLLRVPGRFKERLREIHLRSARGGIRVLGCVTRGRRDIVLVCHLPPRVSLRRFIVPGQSATEFGAPRRGQWPPWAVRRFLLYDVLLHELGHLQLVAPGARPLNRFAGEPLSQRFADKLRREIWADSLPGAASVHDPPTEDELEALGLWERLSKAERYRLVNMVVGSEGHEASEIEFLEPLTPPQRAFLEKEVGATNKDARGSYSDWEKDPRGMRGP
ncbi:MAG: hypothetical protein GY842_22330 [bacterium]|nr:hypothetical protein [bacterium]